MKNIINVVCCVMPSGETLWFKSELGGQEYLNTVIMAWKESNPEYEELCTMGVVNINMPEEKYDAITTSNSFVWPR